MRRWRKSLRDYAKPPLSCLCDTAHNETPHRAEGETLHASLVAPISRAGIAVSCVDWLREAVMRRPVLAHSGGFLPGLSAV